MKVLVAGGSGTIGFPLVRALVRAGHQVTLLSRSAARRREFVELGVSVVQGQDDVGSSAALEQQSRGRTRLAWGLSEHARGARRYPSEGGVSDGRRRIQHG